MATKLSQMSLTQLAVGGLLVGIASTCVTASGIDSAYSMIVGRPFSTGAILLALVVPACAFAYLAVVALGVLYDRGRARAVAALVVLGLVTIGAGAGVYVGASRVNAAEETIGDRGRELCAEIECGSECTDHARACVYEEGEGGASASACLRARCSE